MLKQNMVCSVCRAIGVNKSTCPLNPSIRKQADPSRHNSSISMESKLIRSEASGAAPSAPSYEATDISAFFTSNRRGQNDSMNNKRERIIYDIMTNKINPAWYDENPSWRTIDQKLKACLIDYNVLERRGGRAYCHDFDIENKSTGQTRKMEFKYNADSIGSCPQWVSPMRPSQYMTKSYEEHHYDNYLKPILDLYGKDRPEKPVYLKKVHSSNYLTDVQDIYSKGASASSRFTGTESDILRYQETCRLAKESICTFLQTDVELNVSSLNDHLTKTQKDKIYLVYHDGLFRLEERDLNDYTIDQSSITKTHNAFEGTTVSGMKIQILLRWKNCNGIAFPAFQIK